MDLSDVTFVGGAFMLRLLCDKGGDRWPKALAFTSLRPLSPQGIFTNRGSAEADDLVATTLRVSSLSIILKVMSKNISFVYS